MIARFEELNGAPDVTAITPKMIDDFLAKVEQLPYRPKKEVKVLPLARQIEVAHAQSLPPLSPATVGKHASGIRMVLKVAVRLEWISANPPSGISLEGANWEGTERDHFSNEDMHRIYTPAMMTDPDACDDTMAESCSSPLSTAHAPANTASSSRGRSSATRVSG